MHKKRLLTIVLLFLVLDSIGVMAADKHSYEDRDGNRIFSTDGDPYFYWYNSDHWEYAPVDGTWTSVTNTAVITTLNERYSSSGLTPPPVVASAPSSPAPAPGGRWPGRSAGRASRRPSSR